MVLHRSPTMPGHGTRRVRVRDVLETHDCAGRKILSVTVKEEDELVQSQFQLYNGWMPATDKLRLAMVAPLDEVEVSLDLISSLSLVCGTYIENYSKPYAFEPKCGCGGKLISDGFDVYCTSDQCPLTLAARIYRLSRTVFYPNAQFNENMVWVGSWDGYGQYSEDAIRQSPFLGLLDPVFWGSDKGSLEAVLERDYLPRQYLSMAHFLVPPLFSDFLETTRGGVQPPYVIQMIRQVFDDLNGVRERYIPRSDGHYRLLYAFLCAIAIEGLTPEIISAILNYIGIEGVEDDPFFSIIYALTHPQEMVRWGIHPMEAAAVHRDVMARKQEMFDIFSCYSNSPSMGSFLEDLTRR